jgi:hypothetical protein
VSRHNQRYRYEDEWGETEREEQTCHGERDLTSEQRPSITCFLWLCLISKAGIILEERRKRRKGSKIEKGQKISIWGKMGIWRM